MTTACWDGVRALLVTGASLLSTALVAASRNQGGGRHDRHGAGDMRDDVAAREHARPQSVVHVRHRDAQAEAALAGAGGGIDRGDLAAIRLIREGVPRSH